MKMSNKQVQLTLLKTILELTTLGELSDIICMEFNRDENSDGKLIPHNVGADGSSELLSFRLKDANDIHKMTDKYYISLLVLAINDTIMSSGDISDIMLDEYGIDISSIETIDSDFIYNRVSITRHGRIIELVIDIE